MRTMQTFIPVSASSAKTGVGKLLNVKKLFEPPESKMLGPLLDLVQGHRFHLLNG